METRTRDLDKHIADCRWQVAGTTGFSLGSDQVLKAMTKLHEELGGGKPGGSNVATRRNRQNWLLINIIGQLQLVNDGFEPVLGMGYLECYSTLPGQIGTEFCLFFCQSYDLSLGSDNFNNTEIMLGVSCASEQNKTDSNPRNFFGENFVLQ